MTTIPTMPSATTKAITRRRTRTERRTAVTSRHCASTPDLYARNVLSILVAKQVPKDTPQEIILAAIVTIIVVALLAYAAVRARR